MTPNRTLVLIPARMAATRLPGKPLLDIAGAPMIVHVLRRAEEAAIGRVAVATDTPEIAAVVEAQLASSGSSIARMTTASHADSSAQNSHRPASDPTDESSPKRDSQA